MKNWKEIWFLVPALAAGAAVTVGLCINKPEFREITYPEQRKVAYEEKEPEQTRTPADAKKSVVKQTVKKTTGKKTAVNKTVSGEPKDGTYTGTATCEQFGYNLSLMITFRDGKAVAIYNLKITNNTDSANQAYWEKAWKPVVKQILAKQSGDIDVVSGATYSSNAIVAAYQNAREKAVNQDAKISAVSTVSKKEIKKAKKKVLKEPKVKEPEGEITDGKYHVSSVCKPDQSKAFASYKLSADVVFAAGKLKSITNFSSTAESNRSYYLKAANGYKQSTGVVAQLLAKQSASGISAVSGATCSSKTIRDLYLLALTKVTGTKQKPSSENEEMPVTPSVEENTDKEDDVEDDSSVPPATFPEEDNSDVKDGVYTVTVTVWPDGWEEFMEYTLTADVTFLAGKLISIEQMEISDASNMGYCKLAANGIGTKPGIISQLISVQNSHVDVISGATCSSNALIELYRSAVQLARGGELE